MELELSDDYELEYAEVYTEYSEMLKKISQKFLNKHVDGIRAGQIQFDEYLE